MEIKNEKDTMIVLSNWLSNFNIKIWWNQKNNHNFPQFTTKSSKRSDLLMYANNKYYVIECKQADQKKKIYDAFFQLLNYSIDDTVYQIDDNPIRIDGYLLATENSINGHLFDVKYDILMTGNDFSEQRQWAINDGQIPICEHSMTEMICRLLWRGISEYDIKYPIGVLLSDKLNNSFITPMLLMKHGKFQYMEVIV
jgi:hypothetical protein